MLEEIKSNIQIYIQPLLKKLDVVLFELTVKRQSKIIAFDVIVDHPAGGITIDQCTIINQVMNTYLEEMNYNDGNYTVEVSSPGLDCPLKDAKDFTRVKGRLVKFHLLQKINQKVEHDGLISEVLDSSVKVEINKELVTIPYSLISKAIQVI